MGGSLYKAVFITIFVLTLLQGCSSVRTNDLPGEESGISIDGIIISNRLLYPITDVMITVPATGGFAGCGNILGRSDCRTTFPAAAYRKNAIQVSWKEYGEPHQTAEFVVSVPEDMVKGSDAWLEVIVFASGQAGAKLISPRGP